MQKRFPLNLTFLNKTLKSQTGFSLPEIMIGGSILAGVGLAGAMLFKDQKSAQKKIDDEQALNIFHQNVIRSMNNPFNCNATFKAGTVNLIGASSIPAGTTLPALYSCGSGCSDFKTGVNGVVTGSPLLAKGSFIDNKDLWNVNDIVIPAGVTRTGPLVVKVVYELNPAKFPGKPKVTKDILLNARFSSTAPIQFKECLNTQESSVNNLQNDICKSMTSISSSGSGGGGVIAVWDEATQTCKTNGTAGSKLKTCPADMVVEGIRSDGSVHCKYPSNGVSCPPPTTGVMKMVGGKLKVVCE